MAVRPRSSGTLESLDPALLIGESEPMTSDDASLTVDPPVRVALVGTRGWGEVHLAEITSLQSAGRVRLVGVVDVREPDPVAADENRAPWFPTLGALLDGLSGTQKPEIVVIATPIPTHAPLAREALSAGCDVLLEKPPVTSLAEHRELVAAAARADRSVQVGFQAHGGEGIARLRRIVTGEELGPVRAVTAYGAWSRDRAYYARSPWAGRRRMNGARVADGVSTNPLAHGIHAALAVAGIEGMSGIARVVTELRHAHDIEADDTTFLRIDPPAEGVPPVLAALTTAGPAHPDPWIEVVAEHGRARLYYTADRAEITGDDGAVQEESYERSSLLENLIEHARDRSVPLISDLASTEAFSTVLEATQAVPDPRPIAPEHVTWTGEGSTARPIVRDIEHWLEQALAEGRPFSQIGAPWADAEAIVEWAPPR